LARAVAQVPKGTGPVVIFVSLGSWIVVIQVAFQGAVDWSQDKTLQRKARTVLWVLEFPQVQVDHVDPA
jgi:hypothetical protein